MEALKLEPKYDSPFVLFDPQTDEFVMSGTMHPENIQKFMTPIFSWFNDYSAFKTYSDMNIKMEFFFRYLNSSSYKYLINILQKLLEFQEKGASISILWKYEEEDEDMKDRGLDLFEFTEIPLKYECIAIQE